MYPKSNDRKQYKQQLSKRIQSISHMLSNEIELEMLHEVIPADFKQTKTTINDF